MNNLSHLMQRAERIAVKRTLCAMRFARVDVHFYY